MSRTTRTGCTDNCQHGTGSLLAYVIAYLEEEANGMENYRPELSTSEEIKQMVKDAIDAYEGGAR